MAKKNGKAKPFLGRVPLPQKCNKAHTTKKGAKSYTRKQKHKAPAQKSERGRFLISDTIKLQVIRASSFPKIFSQPDNINYKNGCE